MRRGCEQFARAICSLDELPEAVRPVVEWENAQEIVFIPPQEHYFRRRSWRRELPFGRQWTPARTLVFRDEQLQVVEIFADGQVDHICIDSEALISVHLMSELLYSYVELEWMSQDKVKNILVEFNSVGLHLLESGLALILKQATIPSLGDYSVPAPIKQFPLKFCNYTLDSLAPGEPIEAAVYQPAVRKPGKHYLFPFMSPNRAITLTGQLLIVVEDADARWHSWDSSTYRMDRYYYPRQHVHGITFDQQDAVIWCTVCLGSPEIQHDLHLPLTHTNAAVLQSALTG